MAAPVSFPPFSRTAGGIIGPALLFVIFSVSCSAGRHSAVSADRDATSTTTEPTAAADRKFRMEARLELEVSTEEAVTATLVKVKAEAASRGGYTFQETADSVTVKVPNAKMEEMIIMCAGIGTISSKYVHIVDVTAEFQDLDIRLMNAKKFQTRLRELVDRATKVPEILEVERELSRVTTEVERLEGQMRVLKNQTTFATFHVSVKKEVRPGPVGWIFYFLYVGVKWLFVWD